MIGLSLLFASSMVSPSTSTDHCADLRLPCVHLPSVVSLAGVRTSSTVV